jgi:hypothetical protein
MIFPYNEPPILIRKKLRQKNIHWNIFAITLILFGIQSTANFAVNANIVIPFALSATVSGISYIFIARNMNFDHYFPITIFIFICLFINIISYDSMYYDSYIIGFLQIIYSIFIAISLYFLIRSVNLSALQIWCLSLTAAITLLSVAELNSYVSSIFTSITEILAANSNLGSAFNVADARDLTMHGAVRSKVFATEPSHAALTLMALGFGFFWTKPRFQLVSLWVVMIIICIWTIRSPILAALLLIGPALAFITRETRGKFIQLIGALIMVLVFAFAISDYVLAMFGTRIETGAGSDGSFEMRFTVPLQFMTDFLPTHLLYGVGVVGDFDMLTYEILAAYHERGMSYIDYSNAGLSLSNNLAQHFVSFGLFFGFVALIVLAFVVRMRNGWAWAIICVECLTIWMFLGGYVVARVWVLCTLVLAIARRAELEEAMQGAPVRLQRTH